MSLVSVKSPADAKYPPASPKMQLQVMKNQPKAVKSRRIKSQYSSHILHQLPLDKISLRDYNFN